ncbi:MAG: glycine cleavage system aminomethyltransferase GcvT [Bacteroidota bacterium]|nr:glycine cleavage system aminomethyltransferase GcvT [Bacteroidota bacterium]
MSDLIKTAFYQNHLALGAKMVPYSGFEMPVSYSGLKEEHNAVRNHVGMFDVSHMGEFIVKGPNALCFLQYITSNDVAALFDGKIQYSCMPNGKGGIVDDLLVYRKSEKEYLLVVNASNIEKDWNWINQIASEKGYDVELTNDSDSWSLIALQGPNAISKIVPLIDSGSPNLGELKYYTFTETKVMGFDCIVSATGYTGAGGFEIYMPNDAASKIWTALLEEGVQPCGLGARDTLRMEMGYCLYGNDIDDETNPIEAGLGWITKFNKDFIDKDRLEAIKSDGPTRKLVGLKIIDRGIPRNGYEVVNPDGQIIGEVTSGTMSPTLGIGIGMAYIERNFTKKGTPVYVQIRNKQIQAEVVDFPFLDLA